ncbi:MULTISPECIES: DUF4426 domain-containing protein [Luteimonas]|uniref:DUF4426 domain-containing protein n=1 Tax=Luteimonas TaxID=83614 RepID=UPI000C7A881B|nr:MULTISPECIES: DUF4426 domain-containing protein [Luteimonas]
MTEVRARRGVAALLLALLVACGRTPSTPSQASAGSDESRLPATVQIGGDEVIATVVPTATLNDAIAAQYGITRARDAVLVLVSLRRGDASMRGVVTATASDLRGVRQTLAFREVEVGDLVDYVGIATVTPPDTLRFDIAVDIADGERTTLRFSRDVPRP